MRNKYYDLINKYKITDVLGRLIDIEHSTKIKYLTKLLEEYEVPIINRALEKFKEEYILTNRINTFLIYNQIVFYCKKFTKEKV